MTHAHSIRLVGWPAYHSHLQPGSVFPEHSHQTTAYVPITLIQPFSLSGFINPISYNRNDLPVLQSSLSLDFPASCRKLQGRPHRSPSLIDTTRRAVAYHPSFSLLLSNCTLYISIWRRRSCGFSYSPLLFSSLLVFASQPTLHGTASPPVMLLTQAALPLSMYRRERKRAMMPHPSLTIPGNGNQYPHSSTILILYTLLRALGRLSPSSSLELALNGMAQRAR